MAGNYTKPNHSTVASATRRDLLAHAALVTNAHGGVGLTFAQAVRAAYAAADKAIADLDAVPEGV